jgi:hypothetical protein
MLQIERKSHMTRTSNTAAFAALGPVMNNATELEVPMDRRIGRIGSARTACVYPVD